MSSRERTTRRYPPPRAWGWLLVVVGAFAAAYPLAVLLVGDPFAAKTPRLELVPADEDGTEALYTVPAFEHLNEKGEPFGSAQLAGEPWIASFFFTSCPSICPKLTAELVALQKRLESAGLPTRIVSFTVDPITDRPEVLAAYGEKVGADPLRWTFVTGEPQALYRTIVSGFKQPMGEGEPSAKPREDADVALDIAHGVRFVLVDRDLGIRGLYDANEAGATALLEDLSHL